MIELYDRYALGRRPELLQQNLQAPGHVGLDRTRVSHLLQVRKSEA